MPGGRTNYLSWEQSFMIIAMIMSNRSKDPRTQVGACIVNSENKILSVGYNGTTNGFSDIDDMPWDSLGEETGDILQIKNTFVVHAEANAIANFGGNKQELKGATIYVTLFPCVECTKLIIQNGIKKIVYGKMYSKKMQVEASNMMLARAGVEVIQCKDYDKIQMISEYCSHTLNSDEKNKVKELKI